MKERNAKTIVLHLFEFQPSPTDEDKPRAEFTGPKDDEQETPEQAGRWF